MDSVPFFSIVIATYNRAHLVGKSIGSVTEQSFRNFEIIVVDDGSSDDTAAVIAAIPDSRIIYKVQENAGAAAARNAGARMARGLYYIFLDSDDWLSAGYLEKFFSVLSVHRNPLSFGFVKYADAKGNILRTIMPWKNDITFSYGICGSFSITGELFRKLDGYDPNLRYSENTDLFLRMELGGLVSVDMIELIPDAGVIIGPIVRRQRSIRYATQKYQSVKYFMTKHNSFFDSSLKYFNTFQRIYIVCAIQNNDFKEARRALKIMMSRNPFSIKHYLQYFLLSLPILVKLYYWLR